MQILLHKSGWILLLFIVTIMVASCQRHVPPETEVQLDPYDWTTYRARFVTDDGRVIDEAQHRVTHSEAQAYSMLLATAYHDRSTFDRIWSWSRSHLQVRSNDHLLAWLWREEEQRVLDYNNATDADIVAAWALLRAYKLWHDETYHTQAQDILSSLKTLLRHSMYGKVLRPGAEGFPVTTGIVLNPSYWVFPAFEDFADFEATADWQAIDDAAMKILARSAVGSWQLTPDWLHVYDDGQIQPWEDRKAEFSYDAIRVPLFLAWSGRQESYQPYRNFWTLFNMQEWMPDRVELDQDSVHLRKNFAVPRIIQQLLEHLDGIGNHNFPAVSWYEGINSYEAALQIFCQLAWLERNEKDHLSKGKKS